MTEGSISKISMPVVKKSFSRKRLFKLLDRMRSSPIICVSGPAGCGKTTLVSSYVSERRLPSLWYRMDEGDQDAATFFYYMGLAVKKASRRRKALPLLTPEYLQDIPTFSRRFFESAFRQLKPSTVIVLDNYQLIPEESGFHEVVHQGLATVPEGFHVLLISRSAPPPAWARLQANGRMGILGWNELRLSLEETAGIIRLRADQIGSREAIERLHVGADGWAAGVILMLESVKRGIAPHLLGKMPPEEIINYFGNELFKKMDGKHRDFLLKSAFLTNMTAATAEKLTGIDGAGRILSNLSRNNYFTERLSSVEPTYRYHPLFRAFLLSRGKDLLSPEETHDARQRAARLLDGAGHVEDAAQLYIEAGDWDGLGALIQRNAQSLLARGRIKTLETWLLRIPERVTGHSPWLLYLLGTCRMPFNPAEGRQSLERAFSLFGTESDLAGELLAWSGIVESFTCEFSDYTPLDHWIAVLDGLLDRHGGFPSPEIETRVISNIVCALTYRQPHHPKLHEWKSRLIVLLQHITDSQQRVMIGNWLVLHAIWVGDIAKAKWLIELLRPPSDRDVPPLSMLMWQVVDAIHKWLTGDFHGCLAAVAKGLDIARDRGIHIMDFSLFSQSAYGALSAGDLQAGAAFLESMKAAMNPGRLLNVSNYHFLAGWEAILRDDLPQAFDHVQTALRVSNKIGTPFPQALGHIGMAHALISRKEHGEAQSHIIEALRIGKQMNSTVLEYMALLAEARLAMEQGDEPGCLAALRSAMASGKKQGFVNHPWWLSSVMARLCAKALEAGIEVDYVQDLVRRRNLPPDVSSYCMEDWPWPLKIYTLGRFEVVKDGKPVQYSRKAQEKPLAVLKALIAAGEKETRPEDIADIVWPEADGDAAIQSFQVTLHRLRSLIGCPEAISLRKGSVTLDAGRCWVDGWAFERLLGEADALWSGGSSEKAVRLTESAAALYRGPFLGKEGEETWNMSVRERLRNKFLMSVSRLGGYWSRAEQWEKARECYQKGFDVDDLAEGFCQGLMTCYHRLGQRAEALSLYRRFERRVAAVLGIEPSEKTKALRNAILRASSTR